MKEQDRLLTLKEVAERLNCCERTVKTRIQNRELVGLKLSKRMWRVDPEELERYIRWNKTNVVERNTDASKTLRSFPNLSKSGKSA